MGEGSEQEFEPERGVMRKLRRILTHTHTCSILKALRKPVWGRTGPLHTPTVSPHLRKREREREREKKSESTIES